MTQETGAANQINGCEEDLFTYEVCPLNFWYFYRILAYFPGIARVFIYPNLIVICVPSLADNFYAPWRYITHLSADLHTVTSLH
jgi:hypothetical protein